MFYVDTRAKTTTTKSLRKQKFFFMIWITFDGMNNVYIV